MATESEERSARAARRCFVGGGLARLGDVGSERSPPVTGSAGQRLLNCWALSVDSYLLSGRQWPQYERSQMPGQMLRKGERDA